MASGNIHSGPLLEGVEAGEARRPLTMLPAFRRELVGCEDEGTMGERSRGPKGQDAVVRRMPSVGTVEVHLGMAQGWTQAEFLFL